MPLPKLNLDINQDSYSLNDGDDVVLRAKLSSGLSRQRLDMLDAPIEAVVGMVLEPLQYKYWRAFHRSTLRRGSLPFLADLVVDSAEIEEHEVKIVPGSYEVTVRGDAHLVQFRLEIKLNELSDSLSMLYVAYQEGGPDILLGLEQLVNFHLPALGA